MSYLDFSLLSLIMQIDTGGEKAMTGIIGQALVVVCGMVAWVVVGAGVAWVMGRVFEHQKRFRAMRELEELGEE